MGELVATELGHAHDVLADQIRQVGAVEVHVCADLTEVVRANRDAPLSRKHGELLTRRSHRPASRQGRCAITE